jgi:predicted aconitase with swiveling domain
MAEARTLVAGTAEGPALVLDEPLSLWGGLDPETGSIIDIRHPQRGANVTGRVLILPSGRGSSSSSSVLAEAIRAGTAPAAIVLGEADPILALGAIVARELYGSSVPIVVFRDAPFRTGEIVKVRASERGADVGRSQPHAR